jgi:tryptophan synthase alpha chain
MLPLRQKLEAKLSRGEKLLSIFLTAGYPEPAATLPLLDTLVEAGADLIELGVPFSDPLADGPTIQMASQKALAAGTTLAHALQLAKEFCRDHATPLLLMGYANPFVQMGWEKLVALAREAGVSGFIIPDLPPEESGFLQNDFANHDLDLIHLVSPNTTAPRIARIEELTRSFVYAVSVTGVTGARAQLPEETVRFLQRLKTQVTHPVLMGFGVSQPEIARAAAQHCDGVIIGSAVIERIAAAPDLASAQNSVFEFAAGIKGALAT